MQSRVFQTGALVLALLASASLPMDALAKSSSTVVILQFSDQPLDHRETWTEGADIGVNLGDPDETLGGDGKPSGILVPDPVGADGGESKRHGKYASSWWDRLWGFVMMQWSW